MSKKKSTHEKLYNDFVKLFEQYEKLTASFRKTFHLEKDIKVTASLVYNHDTTQWELASVFTNCKKDGVLDRLIIDNGTDLPPLNAFLEKQDEKTERDVDNKIRQLVDKYSFLKLCRDKVDDVLGKYLFRADTADYGKGWLWDCLKHLVPVEPMKIDFRVCSTKTWETTYVLDDMDLLDHLTKVAEEEQWTDGCFIEVKGGGLYQVTCERTKVLYRVSAV